MTEIRDLTPEDLGALVRWRNDPAVNRHLADRLKSKDEVEAWFNRAKAEPNIWLKAISYKGQTVGYATVESIDEKNRKCELAVVIGESDHWGKGVGTFVLKKMLEYAFDTLHMHRVWAVTARGNDRSERLLKKAGFLHEGVMREAIIIGDTFTDLLCYSILEDEYAMADRPRSLKNPGEIEARKQLLREKHINLLTDFVEQMRREPPAKEVPYFDPLDGGTSAQCLFVLESPGRMTKDKSGSGFVSRNNNDETAKNFFMANKEASLPRKNTVIWNIVPWDISRDGKKQAPESPDIEDGLQCLYRLIKLLPELRAIALVGMKAQKVQDDLREYMKKEKRDIKIFSCPHPSPLNIRTHLGNWQKLVDALKRVKEYLDGLS